MEFVSEKHYQNIYNFALGQHWAIDFDLGIKHLNEIMLNMSMNFDYAKRKAAQAPKICATGLIDSLYVSNTAAEIKKGSILQVDLSGVMTLEDRLCSDGIQTICSTLYAAYANENIAGILINANSGGGEAMAGAVLNSAISDKNKPVLTYAQTLGSAAVLGTLNSSEIIAGSEFAQIGSIGVMTTINNSFLEFYKKNYTTLYSDKSPDKNKAFNDAIAGDFAALKAELTRLDEKFMEAVAKGRKLKGGEKMITETLSGGMFLAADARSRGLVDGIGTRNYAMARLQSLIKNQ